MLSGFQTNSRLREKSQFMFAAVFLLACGSKALSQENPANRRPIDDAENVIAIIHEKPMRGIPRIVLAAWEDGHVVWSENRIEGGSPYRCAELGQNSIPELLKKWEKEGLFELNEVRKMHIGPNASHSSIFVKLANKQTELTSWHEVHELSSLAVGTAKGIKLLEGQTKLQVLSQEGAEYLFFRALWSDLRWQIAALLPSESHPCDGHVVMDDGVLYWSE